MKASFRHSPRMVDIYEDHWRDVSRKFSIWLPSLLPVQPVLISRQAKSGSNSSFHHPTAPMEISNINRLTASSCSAFHTGTLPGTTCPARLPQRPQPNGFLRARKRRRLLGAETIRQEASSSSRSLIDRLNLDSALDGGPARCSLDARRLHLQGTTPYLAVVH